jgi:hypothetical protein
MADKIYVDASYWASRYAGYQADAQVDLGYYIDPDYYVDGYFDNPVVTATLTATATRVRFVNAQASLSVTATTTANVGVVKHNSAAITATVSISATAARSRATGSTLSTTASMSTTAGRITRGNVALTATFTVYGMISDIRGVDIFVFGNAALTAQVKAIKAGNLAASSAFTISTDANRTRNYSSSDDAAFSITTVNQRIRYDQAAISAAFSLAASGDVFASYKQFQATLTATASLLANNTRLKTASATISATASLTVNNTRKRPFVISVATTASQTATVARRRGFDSQLSTVASLSANNQRTRSTSFSQSVSAQLSATITDIKSINLAAFTTVALSASAQAVKSAVSNQLATAALTGLAGKINSLTANLTATASLTGQGYLTNKRPRQSTVYGTLTFDSTNKVQGTHSLFRNDTSSYLEITASKDFNIAANEDFAIDINFKQLSGGNLPFVRAYDPVNNRVVWQFTKGSNFGRFSFWNGSTLVNLDTSNTTFGTFPGFNISRTGNTISFYAGNSGSASTTYSGAISSGTPVVQLGISGNNNHGYYDEFSMVRGATYAPDGKDPNVQFLFHFDNNYVDDMTGLAYAQAQLTTTATQTVQARATHVAASALTSTSTLTANGAGKVNSAANLVVSASELVAFGRIRPEVAGLSATATLSVSATKIHPGQAILTATASLTASTIRYKLFAASLSSQFVLTASDIRIEHFAAALTTSTSLTVQPKYTFSGSSSLTSTFSEFTSPTRTIPSWKRELWFRGVTPGRAYDVVFDDPYVYEYGDGITTSGTTRGYSLVKRNINDGTVVWKYALTIPANAAGITYVINTDRGVYAKLYNNKLYIIYSYSSISSGVTSYYNALAIVNTSTGAVDDYWYLDKFAKPRYLEIDPSNGDVYIAGLTSGTNQALIKYNNSGTVQWKYQTDATTGWTNTSSNLQLVNGNVYWSYIKQYAGRGNQQITKISASTGSEIWTRATGLIDNSGDVHVDANENIYLVGATDTPTYNFGVIAKIDSSGSTVWSKTLSSYFLPQGLLTTDSSGNIYYSQDLTYYGLSSRLISFNSNGLVRYARSFTTSTTDDFIFAHAKIFSDRLFIAGYYGGSTGNSSIIINVLKDNVSETLSAIPFPAATGVSGTWNFTNPTITASNLSYSGLTNSSTSFTTDIGTNSFSTSPTTYAITSTEINWINIVSGYSPLTAQVSLISAPNRLRLSALTASTTAIMTVNGTKVSRAQSRQSVTAQLSTTTKAIRIIAVNLTATAAITAVAMKVTVTGSSLATQATLTAINRRIRSSGSSLATLASITALGNYHYANGISRLTVAASELTVVARKASGLFNSLTTATMVVTAKKIAYSLTPLSTQATLRAQPTKLNRAQAALATTATLTAAPKYIRKGQANLATTASMTINARKLVIFATAQSTTAALSAIAKRTRTTPVTVTAQAALTGSGRRNRLATAGLTTTSTILCSAFKVFRAQAHFYAFDTILTVNTLIHIDLYYQLKIKSETRGLKVTKESRDLTIKSETRVNIIQGRPR